MLKNRNNNQVIDNNQIISFRLIRSEDGTFKITKREVMNRTKHMIAFDRGLDWDDVSIGKNLEDDLEYSKEGKRNLKGLIENIFFRDVQIDVNFDELEEAATIRDLYEKIWDHHIGLHNINTKMTTDIINNKRMFSPKGKVNKISREGALEETRQMIADDKAGGYISKIKPDDDLEDDLDYEPQHKGALKGRIEDYIYFGKYNAKVANIDDLIKASTVLDLSEIIYNCIPQGNKI